MFYTEFDNHDWTQIILSKVHNDFLWLGDAQIVVKNDLIHKVTWLSNEGCNLVNQKNVRKMVETNLNTRLDGRNMKVHSIQDKGVKLLSIILGYNFNHGSRVNSVLDGFLWATYVIFVQRRKVNL